MSYSVQVTHPVLGTTRTVFLGTRKEAKAYIDAALKRTSLITFVLTKGNRSVSGMRRHRYVARSAPPFPGARGKVSTGTFFGAEEGE